MNKSFIFLIVILMAASLFMGLVTVPPTAVSNQIAVTPMNGTVYHGAILIEPNGTINASVPGAPITKSGNTYTLSGDINGTLIVERSSATLNGAGFIIYNSSSLLPSVLNISNSKDVSVSNVVINATGVFPFMAISLYNTTQDNLYGMNVSAASLGLMVSNDSSNITVTHSSFSPSRSPGFTYGAIVSGFYMGPVTPLPVESTSNITLTDDTFNTSYGAAVATFSNGTTVKDSTINAGNLLGTASIVSAANDTMISGNTFNLNDSTAINVSNPLIKNNLTNIQITGNQIHQTTGPATNTESIIVANGNSTVSDNNLQIIETSGSFITGMRLNGGSTVINGNTLDFLNSSAFASSYAYGIVLNFTTFQVTDNNVNGSAYLFYGIYANEVAPTNSAISGNNLTFSTARQGVGIIAPVGSDANNLSITDNQLNYSNFLSNRTVEFGIFFGNIFGNDIPIISHNVSVSNNALSFYGNGSYAGLELYRASNVSIDSNSITSHTNPSGQSYLMETGLLNYSNVESNSLTGSNTGYNTAMGLLEESHFNVGNNSVMDVLNGTNVSDSNNLTFEGNYFSHTSGYAMSLFSAQNVTLYHNDFINYTAIEASNTSNIRFNLSYPIGGNYYSNLQGSFVDLKSGPNQNVAGSDGINDSSYSPAPGIVDHYPLAYKWTRPQVTFTEPVAQGTQWTVIFNNKSVTTAGTQVAFNILNGTYQKYVYVVNAANGYHTAGTVSYAGSSLNVPVSNAYALTVKESGLPSGAEWLFNFSGKTYFITNSSMTFAVDNGTTYSYTAYGTSEYYTLTTNGNITVNQSNVNLDLQYYHYAYLSGSVTPSTFTLYLNGTAVIENGTSFNTTIQAGTYEMVITSPGYETYYKNFTVSYNQTEQVNVNLVKIGSSSGGLSTQDYYYIGGAAVAAVVAAVAVMSIRKTKK